MNKETKPLLTIGMIVKNEIRCIERCLSSLTPLREAIPCELIIADTGSDDGTREAAQRYADQLFDFEWINDFAAARNAVIDRAQGEWFFTIDADEWLDEDFSQLTEYLCRPDMWGETNICGITVRNYTTADLAEGPYDDFLALRIFRCLPGVRYTGTIHEETTLEDLSIYLMPPVVLNHDGYLGLKDKRGEAKRERNMALLRKKLAENPQDLLTLQQCIDSSGDTPERFSFIRQAVAGVEEHWPNWQVRGPVILRYAADIAQRHQLPELWDWIKRAEEWFPNSMFTRAEIRSIAFWTAVDQQKYADAIHYGEAYLQAMEDYRAGRYDPTELLRASMGTLSPTEERHVRLQLADVYLGQKEYSSALEVLLSVKIRETSAQQIQAVMGTLLNLQARSGLDLTAAATSVWEQLTVREEDGAAEEENSKRANQRRMAALLTAACVFPLRFREKEEAEGLPRHAYTLFLPLAERCDFGRAAALLECDSLEEIDRLLSEVEDWSTFPAAALARALDQGGAFPVEGKSLPMEMLDALAARLTEAGEDYLPELCVCMPLPEGDDWESAPLGDVNWARALLLAAVQRCDWKKPALGMALARRFVAFERAFLPQCYTPMVLEGEGQWLLPPLHRFGVRLIEAFDALDEGDMVAYVRGLRSALTAYEGMKPMAEFLLEQAQETSADVSAELVALAAQVKAMLAAFPEGDPRLQQLRESPAYQQAAFLLENKPAHDGIPPS